MPEITLNTKNYTKCQKSPKRPKITEMQKFTEKAKSHLRGKKAKN